MTEIKAKKVIFKNRDGEYLIPFTEYSGLEIGDIGFTQMAIDETKGKRRALNKTNNIIIQEQYPELTQRIKKTRELFPDYFCTESEWQTELTMSPNGVCYKFVIDDKAGTIRLPKYPNYFIAGLKGTAPVVGNGQTVVWTTNGTNAFGTFVRASGNDANEHFYVTNTTGAIGSSASVTSGAPNCLYGISTNPTKSGIEAQLSNNQTEQIRGTYFIQVATGAETEDNIINEIELNNPFSLLDYKYSEYELNNLSWLRSNGQWNSKAVYPAVYELLLKIYNGTEIKTGVSVKLATGSYTDYDFVLNTAEETFRLPIKVKLASGKAVVGNGTQMHYEDFSTGNVTGIVYGGTISTVKVNYLSMENTKELPAVDAKIPFTIASDPTKSGIETSDSDLYLYFYVGETVQNANLINAGRIQETYTTKSMVDGQWVQKYAQLSTATAVGTYTLDLNSYLPNDGYTYEVQFYIGMASANETLYTLGTKAKPWTNRTTCLWGTVKTTSNARFATGNFTLPINNRVVYSEISTSAVSSFGEVYMVGYRRLGTNA